MYERMERSLEQALASGAAPPLGVPDRLRVACDVLRGLEALHGAQPRRLVHRDVKPSNIMLCADGTAKLCDFGFARVLSSGSAASAATRVVGSDGYLDPLYSESGVLGPPSDIYSFGVVLLRLLTGAPAAGLVAFLRPTALSNPDGCLPGFMSMLAPMELAWSEAQALALLRLCSSCLALDSGSRPTAAVALLQLMPLVASLVAAPEEERTCCICVTAPRAVTFHCGHHLCCVECATQLLERRQPCPTCRAPIQAVNGSVWMEGDQSRSFVAALVQAPHLPLRANDAMEVVEWEHTIEGRDILRRLAANDATLTALSVWGGDTNLGNAGVAELARALAGNATLTKLSLTSSNIDDAGATELARALAGNATLTELYLEFNNIDDAGATELARALAGNATLTELCLEFNNIDVAGATALARALAGNATLKDLFLSRNNIGDAGATELARALVGNATLKVLGLEVNNIDVAGATALARALAGNATLKDLFLSRNNIGDAGATELARALAENATLTNLSLGSNNIGAAGAIELARALAANAPLTELFLYNNNIGDAGATELARALSANTTLTKLHLARNNIGDAGATELARALSTNTTLTNLSLDNNNIGDAGATELAAHSRRVRI